jgi:hypothetical protein
MDVSGDSIITAAKGITNATVVSKVTVVTV